MTVALNYNILRRSSRTLQLWTSPSPDGKHLVFRGGRFGEHSIPAESDRKTVLAHWAGYCANNGLAVPVAGATVKVFDFGHARTAKVVSATELAAIVRYQRINGTKVERRINLSEVVV